MQCAVLAVSCKRIKNCCHITHSAWTRRRHLLFTAFLLHFPRAEKEEEGGERSGFGTLTICHRGPGRLQSKASHQQRLRPRSPEVLLSKMCMPCGWDKGQRAGSVLHYHCTLRDWQRFFIGPVPAKIKTKALRSRPTFNCILCRQHYRELQSKHQTHKIP